MCNDFIILFISKMDLSLLNRDEKKRECVKKNNINIGQAPPVLKLKNFPKIFFNYNGSFTIRMFSGACHPEISEDIFCIISMEKACHPYKGL